MSIHPRTLVAETAETVVRLLKETHATQDIPKLAIKALKRIQCLVQEQQHRIHAFSLTVDALEAQHTDRKQQSQRILQEFDNSILDLEEKIQALSRERSTFDSTLAELEDALQAKRDYANQRRLKKSKREKQYHHFYSIPMIASRYEKKYIRARDKNAQAEDQLCDIRKAIDQLHVSTREMDSLQHRQQLQIDTVTEQRQTFTSEMSIAEERLQFMKEGQAFWNHTATHQGFKLLQACERLKVSSIADIHEQNSLASFQMTCVEYDESVAYGESRWDPRHLEMEFSCTQCSSWQNGWPMVDPAHTNALLCQSCVENMQVSKPKFTTFHYKRLKGIKAPWRSSSSSIRSSADSVALSHLSSSPSSNHRLPVTTINKTKTRMSKRIPIFSVKDNIATS